jgi:hypothetical protein
MFNLKLGVEVLSAHDLLLKEQGTANAFVKVELSSAQPSKMGISTLE